MADRTWVRVYCRANDKKHFVRKLYMDAAEVTKARTGGFVELYDSDKIPDMSGCPKDRPFIWQHGSGVEFGPFEGVCDGKQFSELSTGYGDRGARYVIDWSDDPAKLEEQIERIRHHVEIKRRAMKLFASAV